MADPLDSSEEHLQLTSSSPRPQTQAPPPAALAVDAAGLARMLGISERHVHQLRASGKLGPEPIRFGRSVRYSVDEVKAWIATGAPSRARWQTMRRASA